MGKVKSTKFLKLKTWKLTSEFVRQRDGRCVTCGRVDDWKNLDCGHYIPNTERSAGLGGNELWYDLRNLNAQCGGCNRWGHGNLSKYAEFLEEKSGHGILQN